MEDFRVAKILSEIGGMIRQEAGTDPDGAFLYVEAEDGVVGPSLFKEIGPIVKDLDISHDLSMKIMDLWDAADPNRKWAALFLTIQGDQFDARFQYPEEWGDADAEERRDRVLAAKYGNKTIVYPGWDA